MPFSGSTPAARTTSLLAVFHRVLRPPRLAQGERDGHQDEQGFIGLPHGGIEEEFGQLGAEEPRIDRQAVVKMVPA